MRRIERAKSLDDSGSEYTPGESPSRRCQFADKIRAARESAPPEPVPDRRKNDPLAL